MTSQQSPSDAASPSVNADSPSETDGRTEQLLAVLVVSAVLFVLVAVGIALLQV